MLKLLFTIGVFLMVALALLGLRQHRLELTSQTAKLHDQIIDREQVLWGQQEQIARKTNPLAVSIGLNTAAPELNALYSTQAPAPPTGRGMRGGGGDPGGDLIAPLRHGRHAP